MAEAAEDKVTLEKVVALGLCFDFAWREGSQRFDYQGTYGRFRNLGAILAKVPLKRV